MPQNADFASEARSARIPDIEAEVFVPSLSIMRINILEQMVAANNKGNAAFYEKVGTVFHNALDREEQDFADVQGYSALNDPAKREVVLLLEKRSAMMAKITRVHEHVAGPLAAMGTAIQETYKKADDLADAFGFNIPLDRAALRVLMMGGRLLPVTDFDGTMTHGTEHIGLMPTHTLEDLLTDEHLGRGRFLDATLPAVHRIKKNFDLMYQVGAQHVHFRPGVGRFITYCNETLDSRPIILTANYIQVLQGALSNLPEADGQIRIVGVTPENVVSTNKGTVLQYFARTNPDRAIFFIADSHSDSPSLDARDNVAFYFALKGGGFEKLCDQEKLLYVSYESFNDVVNCIELIEKRAGELYNQFNQPTPI